MEKSNIEHLETLGSEDTLIGLFIELQTALTAGIAPVDSPISSPLYLMQILSQS